MADVVNENQADIANTAESASTTEENQSAQAQESEDMFELGEVGSPSDNGSTETSDDKTSNESSEEQGKTEQGTAEDASAKGAERRKEQLNTEIRELVAKRNAIREETARIIQAQYKIDPETQGKSEDELVDEINPATGDYYTRAEAQAKLTRDRLDWLEAERRQEVYANQVAEARFAMDQEAGRVISDFPMFDPQSSEYNSELASSATEILSGAIDIDPQTGLQIGCRIPIYQFYSLIAKSAEAAKKQGEISGRTAAQKMMGEVDMIGGNHSRKGVDDDMDDFAKMLLDD